MRLIPRFVPRRTSALVLCATALCAGPAHAGGPPTVLLLPADNSTNFNDAQTRIAATGLFAQVDVSRVLHAEHVQPDERARSDLELSGRHRIVHVKLARTVGQGLVGPTYRRRGDGE